VQTLLQAVMLRNDTRFSKAKIETANRLFFEKMIAAKEKSVPYFSEQPTPAMLKQPPTDKQASNNPISNPTSNENQHTIKIAKVRMTNLDYSRKNRIH
jgi:hypothetical protein